MAMLLLANAVAAAPANVVTFLIDDMDLERVPFYPRLDAGAAWQHLVHMSGGGCRGGANCTYSTPSIDGVGARGVRFLGAHVPVSVCTPSRYSFLTGRLPSSSPFYSATKKGKISAQVDISWNTWLEQGTAGLPCCGPGIPRPCAPARMWGCARRAKTLGSMLQAAQYYTGFVGKWHLSPAPPELGPFMSASQGKFPEHITEENEAGLADLQARYAAAREEHLASKVRVTGFNYTGALSVGNVIDLTNLGLGVHNLDWEAQAGVDFLEEAHGHVASGHARAYFLHLCTTLTHSPGPNRGICADPRLSEGGMLPRVPNALPSRASVMARTGGARCGWQEYDAVHTLWVDDAIGALVNKLRALGDEENTLFIALADHQRVGKGTLYHGIRTPMVLQFPARVPGGQTLPASTLVSSLDIVPTALDAAGLLPHPPHPPDDPNSLPYNAGKRLDGRSLLPLLSGGFGFEAPDPRLVEPPWWWRDAIFSELGVAATVKHKAGWQLVALHMPDEFELLTDGGTRGLVRDVVACEHERLRTGATWENTFTHARHCVWRDTNHSLSTNLIGEARVRFDSNERYQNYHSVEQLLHWPTDLAMEHDYKTRCPRQLACLQSMLRAERLTRVHFDGDSAPFGEYTWPFEQWSTFQSGGCDMSVLSLDAANCNEGLPTERSVMDCAELAEEHAPTAKEAEEEAEEDELWVREPHAPPMCAATMGDCLESHCCANPGEHCFQTLLGTAHCKGWCHPDDTWTCAVLQISPPPPPPRVRVHTRAPTARWQRVPSRGVCIETLTRDTASGSVICPGPMVHRDARHWCRSQGARLCSSAELMADVVTADDPCDLDTSRVWTTDSCALGDKHFVSIGGSAAAIAGSGDDDPIDGACMHQDQLLPVVCCADDAQPPSPPTLPASAPQYPPPPSPPISPSPSPPRPPCTSDYQNCFESHCCLNVAQKCYQKYAHVKYAQCRPRCPSEGWECIDLTEKVTQASAAAPILPGFIPLPKRTDTDLQPSRAPSPTSSLPGHSGGGGGSTAFQPPVPQHDESASQSAWAQQSPPPAPSLNVRVKDQAKARDAGLKGKESRLFLYAVATVAVVVACACAVVCVARNAAQREVGHARRAQGVAASISSRLKVDLRARRLAGKVPAAYIQMAAPTDDLTELAEESLSLTTSR